MYDENQFYHYSYKKPEEQQSAGEPQNQAAGNTWQPVEQGQQGGWQNSQPVYPSQPVWEGSTYPFSIRCIMLS